MWDRWQKGESLKSIARLFDRGHPVTEVAQRLGVSSHSLYKWVKAVKPDQTEENAAEQIEAKSEILKLRAQLWRTEEERNIQKKAARYFAMSATHY